MVELFTSRLRLRHAEPSDLHALHGVLSQPAAMRYWSTPPHAYLDATQAWLDKMIAGSSEGSPDFVIEYRGQVIGKAGCWRLPEIGYILHPEHWGQGLAREAVTAVIAHVFATTPVPALTADVDPRNAASLNLLARLGFKETHRVAGTWLVGDEWCDSIYLALARP
jgi:ribosomal-protein-alanine N-acetyltransferase